MSGVIGYEGRSGLLQQSPIGRRIYKGLFNFQYGGQTWSTGYTLPDKRKCLYYAIMTFAHSLWDSAAIINSGMGNGGADFGLQRLIGNYNYIKCTTAGLIQCHNQNGGSSGNLSSELRVYEWESPTTGFVYLGGS